MPVNKNILKYPLVAIVALLLAGLAAWYFFLDKQAQTITSGDSARGLGTSAPSFGSAIGSTYSNIVSGITALVGGAGTEPASKIPPQLWRVTKTPVAGMGFVGSATSSKLYFAERSTGYILEADPKTGALVRLTNKLFPKTYEAVFSRDGSVVLRSINEDGGVDSFAGSLASTSVLAGNYLTRNIRAIVPDPETHGLLYMVKNDTGEGVAVRSSWSGAKPKIVFTSPLSSWKLTSLDDGRTFFTLQPADNVPGFAYELKSSGSLVPEIQDVPGLTFLPRASSTAILYGASAGGTLNLFAKASDKGQIFPLSIRTVADKCVWDLSNKQLIVYCAVPQFVVSNTFLNDWYRGVTHTSDSWWRADANDGTVELVFSPSEGDESLDVENPVIDASGEHIAFMNAVDKTLWLLRISK
ncbi:MAG: hypothetical protein AAB830_00160 [Patescibacteria group bacterium]|mgnify:FL=1